MSKPIQIHKFEQPIYPYTIWVAINKTPQFISETFTEEDKSEIVFIEEDNHKAHAFTMTVMSKDKKEYGTLLYFRSKISMTSKVIAHESVHAAKNLFKHIGADIAPHEPFEYIVGWIAECCDVVRKWKNKTKVSSD
ncbi:hypothetical protein U5907_02425 [Bacteroidales bacterium MB20-C3-3]|nr:hypothetical protein U5907_02425 [Bacteroidales bacterium MB20-C3-3]